MMNTFVQLGKLGVRRGVGLAQRRGYALACPSCGAGLSTALPVCGRCKYVGSVHESVTYHELLGLPYRPNPFVVNIRELKRRFVEAQRLCHPDGWATRSEGDKEAALAMSNAVNTAYKTLLSPIERIEYVLRRHGKEMGETEGVDDMALIADVLATREAIEGSGGEELGRLKEDNEGKKAAAMRMISDAVEREDWTMAKTWAVKLKYFEGIDDAIEEAENE